MRIAIVTDGAAVSRQDLGALIALRGLERLLADHALTRLAGPLNPGAIDVLRDQDAIVVLAAGSAPDLSPALDAPVIPIDPAGPALLFARATPFPKAEPRLVLCPRAGVDDPGQRRLYRALGKLGETLFLAAEPRDLCLGAVPGSSTLCAPRAPLVALKAIASAKLVVTARVEIAVAAIANDVPAFLYSPDEAGERLAESLGIPRVRARDATAELEARLAAYPWEEIRRRADELETTLARSLAERGISPARSASRVARLESGGPSDPRFAVCCMADREYLPFLRGFIENLRETAAPMPEVHVLALGEGLRPFLARQYADLPLTIYELEDLWEPGELPAIRTRDLAHRAYASKPRLMSRALAAGRGPVFYFDLDIHLFRSPAALCEEFRGRSLLLFPNWNDDVHDSCRFGVFNAGMLGVAPGAEKFLRWWGQLCLTEYRDRATDAYYVDQGFLDLVPLYFDDYSVYRKGDENVARWNLASAVARFEPAESWTPVLATGRPIGSFHAAQPDALGAHEIKFAWDQMAAYFACEGWRAGSRALASVAVEGQKRYWLALSRLDFACQAFARVCGRRLVPTHPIATRLLLRGIGGRLLALAARLHYRLRRRDVADPRGPWPEVQRAFLLAESEKRSRTVERRPVLSERPAGPAPVDAPFHGARGGRAPRLDA